ncbi:MAG: hypothetical protein L6R39_006003 [Caloplaca ligustica]|nr:MAG: hypothetical protein L6R39_006003 [Caloplaca ligustica]
MGRTALNSIGTRRQPLIENGESSTSETQTTSSLALRPSPTSSVDATQPEKTGGPTSSGNGSAAVFGNERHSTRPLSRQLAEISRERSSLAQAPPLSFTPEFTPPKARKRLTAADFFNPESAPKYGGSDPEPLEFSMQDVTELIQEEKSRAADRAQQRTTQPLDIQDEQHAYGEESSDVDDFPLAFRAEGTNPKAGRNRRTTRYHIKQRRKHYDETMFSQTKPVFPAPSGANAPVVRLPRSTTGLGRTALSETQDSGIRARELGRSALDRTYRQRNLKGSEEKHAGIKGSIPEKTADARKCSAAGPEQDTGYVIAGGLGMTEGIESRGRNEQQGEAIDYLAWIWEA